MKKIDLGQTLSILANIGVIAGIVFLAFELRQNNELLEAATRDSQNDRITGFVEQVYTVPGLAEILLKSRTGEPLTEVEELQLLGRKVRLLRGFEAQYRESRRGTAEAVPVSNWITFFNEGDPINPPLRDVWEEMKPILSPDFVQFIDENVFSGQ